MLNVGLAGVGHISKAHIPVWQSMENVCLSALCSRNTQAMEPYGDVRKYTDYDTMLREEKLHIVDICVPTFLHREYAVKAMEMGCHVICEKPVSLRKEDIAKMYDAARANGVQFMVAQVLRFWPEYEFVKQLYDSGKYGKLLSGSMTRLGHIPAWSWDGWMADEKRSGLIPFDLHIHDLDFMVYAFGKPHHSVRYRAKRADQDYLTAVYEFDGFFISCESAWYAPQSFPFGPRFRFQFEGAVVTWEKGELTVFEKDGETLTLGKDQEQNAGLEIPKSNAYGNEIRYFTDCVKQAKPVEKVKQEELETVLELLKQF